MSGTTVPLVLEAVTKRYAARTVLDAVTLTVEPGATVVLRGPNGAGKSTLLGCIAGTVIPDEGRIAIGGHDLRSEPLAARAALRYLPQEPEVPVGLSGRELLGFFADAFGDPGGAERAAAFLGFGEALERFASTYSVGMRRQLMFAALLAGAGAGAGQGRLWVLDEPFAGVDAEGRGKIRGAIERALGEGAGVVIAAHDRDVQDVEPLSPRVFELGAT
ncbi:ATP-binding cassette domain-containing protein [Paraliomyxa miuraensis]|uniref:ATP-binding cassette domain-containing protein n=1 Tax=Paraliomyxa miuraensis TaxID=376150 RepID=UPI00224D9DE4|nr:ABC transporter ATP-binding protein [Paraliomyxa miuraensis]MCX4244532.1 ABC transporter ATP-binding protein [Paraliomyxa miuraensis]